MKDTITRSLAVVAILLSIAGLLLQDFKPAPVITEQFWPPERDAGAGCEP